MNQKKSLCIVLGRIEYGEADRILSIVTPEEGKLSLMAKGVRRIKSKLAGGIELFSENEITYIPGKGEVGTLVSSRLVNHYPEILKDINRTMLGYDFLKLFNKITEQQLEREYYEMLKNTLEGLNDDGFSSQVLQFWFWARLLALGGHSPNLNTDKSGHKLQIGQKYNFDFESMTMYAHGDGAFGEREIKLLRLLFTQTRPAQFKNIENLEDMSMKCQPLLSSLKSLYLQT